nr:reverse transcriptase domain-containing protein [Tanacetum cinerariifolium]
SSLPKVVERETEVTKDTMPPTYNGSTKDTERALIDVYEGELTLHVGNKAVTFNLDQTSRYSSNYDDILVNRIDVIDVACEENSQEVLGFFVNGDPTPSTELIVSTSSPTLTPFGDSDFLLEETDAFLAIKDEPISPEIDDSYPWESPVHCVPKKGGFIVVKNEENELIPTQLVTRWRVCIDYLKLNDATHKDHFPLSFMDQMLERLEGNEYYYFLDAFSGYFQIPVDPQDQEKTTFTCPYGKFAYRRMPFGLSRPMTRLLEKDIPFIFSKECIKAFQSLKKKLTEALILVSPDWDLPFELMCDASDFAIGAVLGQRKPKHFLPIHYASKTKTDAQAHYTTTEKELLAMVKPLIFLKLATMDPSGDITARTTSPKRCLTPVSIGPQSTMMAMTWSNLVTLVNVRKISQRDEMPQNAIQVCEILTYEASISWGLTVFTREQVMLKYGITHRLATAYHPQTSGQVEVSNRGLKRILERTVGENHASWSDKLDDTLWAFRKAFKTPIGCTPYKLVYGKACHLSIKLEHKAYWALKHANFDLLTAGDHQKVQLNELNELCDQAYENSLIYKKKTNRIHDSKIKDRVFNIGDQVPLFNSRLKIFSGKLKTHWTGPFTVTQAFPYGIVELSQTDRPNFKVNGHKLKHYFGGDIPPMVVLDL